MPRQRSGATLLPWLTARQDCKELRFIQVGNTLLLDKRYQALSTGARCLYQDMLMEAGGKPTVEFSRGTAQKKYGVPKNSFSRYITELKDAGFIVVEQDGNFYQFAPNVYRFSLEWRTKPAPQIGAM